MLRSILIGLDGSLRDARVEELGCLWARRFDARLTGIAIGDDPGVRFTGDGLVAAVVREPIEVVQPDSAREPFRSAFRAFVNRCGGEGVSARAIEAVGSPHAEIVAEAQRHDLILLGTRSRFEYGWEGEAGQTLRLVLEDCPRPVVAVPHDWTPPAVEDETTKVRPIAVAYDGSFPAARALYALQASGLARSRPVHVISVDADRGVAIRHADRASDFLRAHEVEVVTHPLETVGLPAPAILERLLAVDAELLVMGAYGQPTLREFFIGSVTRDILGRSPVPVFCDH